ncbi:calcium uniporter protein, mitochondrial-like [Sycon ciliatum]|uniref:calcium uniporter protein, mitochondrial-like n=1 Tax=Sycon ciliatum TaxID=27933 RepID=UPI0020AE346D|eukprot:scpid47894/ scgid35183/ Calcium uniporter protein, mitochondrial; Coiled-coil domain-containing protein 109A
MEMFAARSLLRFPGVLRGAVQTQASLSARCFSASAARHAVSAATVSLRAGVPSVTIRLPGSDDACMFACPPLTHKVSDLVQEIKAQDKSIDVVSIRTSEGEVLADGTTTGILLRSDFVIQLDGASFPVTVPEEVRNCVEHLDDVRSLVSRLHTALKIAEFDKTHQESLKTRLSEVDSELNPLHSTYEDLAAKARTRNNVMVWGGLGFMGAQFGLLARLTWWEYSWDIMEPVTYFVTYGTAIFCYAYFVLTREDYTFPAARDRNFLLNLHKSFKKSDFPVEKYNELISESAKIRDALERMKDPVQAPEELRKRESSV